MSNRNWETNSSEEHKLVSSTGEYDHHSSNNELESDEENDIPIISNEWRKSISLLTISLLCFILGLIFYSVSLSFFTSVGIIGFSVCGFLYVIFKFGAGYYIYQDAKKIRVHSGEEETLLSNKHRFVWEPRGWYWGGAMIISPPFVEAAPLAVYLSRRRDILGIP